MMHDAARGKCLHADRGQCLHANLHARRETTGQLLARVARTCMHQILHASKMHMDKCKRASFEESPTGGGRGARLKAARVISTSPSSSNFGIGIGMGSGPHDHQGPSEGMGEACSRKERWWRHARRSTGPWRGSFACAGSGRGQGARTRGLLNAGRWRRRGFVRAWSPQRPSSPSFVRRRPTPEAVLTVDANEGKGTGAQQWVCGRAPLLHLPARASVRSAVRRRTSRWRHHSIDGGAGPYGETSHASGSVMRSMIDRAAQVGAGRRPPALQKPPSCIAVHRAAGHDDRKVWDAG